MSTPQPHSVMPVLTAGDSKDTYELDADIGKGPDVNLEVTEADDLMPESLRSLSESELALMERKLVRKADLVIM
jgi:hypothetical protein